MVGSHVFTDLDYADKIALPSASRDELTASMERFSEAAETMGFQVSWLKTKEQSMGHQTLSVDVSSRSLPSATWAAPYTVSQIQPDSDPTFCVGSESRYRPWTICRGSGPGTVSPSPQSFASIRRASCRCVSMKRRHGHYSLQIFHCCRLSTCAATCAVHMRCVRTESRTSQSHRPRVRLRRSGLPATRVRFDLFVDRES